MHEIDYFSAAEIGLYFSIIFRNVLGCLFLFM
jgi:hypothetical protein